MKSLGKREPLVLLVGDIFFFVVSLWLSLLLRSLSLPTLTTLSAHLVPFGILFVVWMLVFYIAGLYDRHTLFLRSRLPTTLLNAQISNSTLAVIFFYLIPLYGITPKVVLFIDLVVTFILILGWRTIGYSFIGSRVPEKAILIGSGEEMHELLDEVNNNSLHGLRFITSVDLSKAGSESLVDEIVKQVYAEGVSIVAIDLMHTQVTPILPHLYNLIFSKVRFIDMHKIYEDIFDRVPLSLLRYNWFIENISNQPQAIYDGMKRLMDVFIGLVLALVSIIFYPFIVLAIKLDDGGVLFSKQKRVGQNDKIVTLLKFRTMTVANDNAAWATGTPVENKVTRVGKFLRKTRLDELPQLWNVVFGDISLIGPRPEFPDPVKHYTEEIPYYNIRHIIKPGLSGWAQIYGEHAHHGTDINLTRNKLSYDLYYIKNRSLLLDIKIALRTIKTILSAAGK